MFKILKLLWSLRKKAFIVVVPSPNGAQIHNVGVEPELQSLFLYQVGVQSLDISKPVKLGYIEGTYLIKKVVINFASNFKSCYYARTGILYLDEKNALLWRQERGKKVLRNTLVHLYL